MEENRILTSIEQGMELFNSCAHSLNVVIISRIKGNLTKNILRKSLDLLQYRHPRLGSHIVYSSNSLKFETQGTQAIPLQVLINSEPNFWQTVVVHELNTGFQSSQVLLRAILIKQIENIQQNYLITTIHHAIIDALCGVHLHSEILQCCQKLALGQEITNFPRLSVLPSLENLIANREKKNPELQKPIQEIYTLPIERFVPHQERQCRLTYQQIETRLTNKIIKSCKDKQTTVHGAICAAMMLALADQIDRKDKDFYFSCRSSVDMRKRITPPISHENLAVMVSALTSFHSLSETTAFWDLAKKVSQQIKDRLETEEIYNVILNYKKGAEYLLESLDLTRFSIFVTNIGKVGIASNYEPLELEAISYALSTTVMGSVFGVAVSTFQDKMSLNFIWAKPLINQEKIESLISKTISYLSNYC